MRRATTVLALTIAATLAAPLGAAQASCLVDDRPIEDRLGEYAYVFKGQVVDLTDEDRTARFAVEEVWRGTLGAEVTVHGGAEQDGPAGQAVITSVDRSWSADTTYLVTANADPRGLVDNACSATTEWDEELAVARPADWSAPEDAQPEDEDGFAYRDTRWVLAGAGAIALAALAAAGTLAARRRRSSADVG